MNIKRELINARRISKQNPAEAFELYDELYRDHRDEFSQNDIDSYCWAIFHSSQDIFKACKQITALTTQKRFTTAFMQHQS